MGKGKRAKEKGFKPLPFPPPVKAIKYFFGWKSLMDNTTVGK
ncbi:hypothetical protein FDUTEX481_07504 [Tolypothrix sp. PCC 7601]|nr:hypothetical protein FDUTEX481_07504 [Tolypothrix sp. PCC 7601]